MPGLSCRLTCNKDVHERLLRGLVQRLATPAPGIRDSSQGSAAPSGKGRKGAQAASAAAAVASRDGGAGAAADATAEAAALLLTLVEHFCSAPRLVVRLLLQALQTSHCQVHQHSPAQYHCLQQVYSITLSAKLCALLTVVYAELQCDNFCMLRLAVLAPSIQSFFDLLKMSFRCRRI